MISSALAKFLNIKVSPYCFEYRHNNALYQKAFTVADVVAVYIGHCAVAVIAYIVFVLIAVLLTVAVTAYNCFLICAVSANGKTGAKGRIAILADIVINMVTVNTVFNLFP